MSSATGLDRDTIAWLSTLDPSLGFLAVAPPRDRDVSLVAHDVSWTPGGSCRLAFRRSAPGTQTDFLAVAVQADGWRSHDFRDDAALPGLRSATDPDVVARLLAPVLGDLGAELRIEPVRYRPGSRCVLRYDATSFTGLRTFYAKVLDDRSFDGLRSVLDALQEKEGWRQLGPRVVAVWPELRTVVTAGVPGVSGAALLGDVTKPLTVRARLAHQLGDLLGRLHALEGVAAPGWSATDQVTSLRDAAAAAVRVDAELGARANQLLDRLEARLPDPDSDVLSHGGFRAGQVVVGDGAELALLDMDGCRLSDRCLDLGTALAQLFWRTARQEPAHQPLEDALLAGYLDRTRASALESLDWWRAAALLQVAVRRYRRLETWDWPSVPILVAEAARFVDAWDSRPAPVTGTDLLDLRRMTTVLGPLLSEPTVQGATLESPRRLAVADGRRVVVRYSLRTSDDEPARSVIAKVFADLPRAHLLDEHLRVLRAGPFRAEGFRVPEPLGVVDEERLVLFGTVEGAALGDITDPVAIEEGCRRAAQWLVRLHTSDVKLPRVLSLHQEAVSTQQWASSVGRAFPHLAARAERLAAGWEVAARSIQVTDGVPLHKDFHAGHVHVGAEVSVVDLDEARMGDPALDLAHFCVYLEAVRGQGGGAAPGSAFLQVYAEGSGWSDRGSFGPWCAYTWLKIAKQRAFGRGPLPPVPLHERRSGVEAALNEGERWLNG
ncbi:MAG TPA: phosphotransferase [Marmoricola sp.]|nr:phosphotransferase [Marmoricola sp.]